MAKVCNSCGFSDNPDSAKFCGKCGSLIYIPNSGTEESNPTYKNDNDNCRLTIQRNDPCPCGSGRKYKNCHGRLLH